MKLILEQEVDDVILTFQAGDFTPYILSVAHAAAEEKFGTIDVSGVDNTEEWNLLEISETDYTYHDVIEFVENISKTFNGEG